MTALTHLALAQEVQRLKTENAQFREALGCISRLRKPPDHETDAFAFVATKEIARIALSLAEVAEENVIASESVLDGVSR